MVREITVTLEILIFLRISNWMHSCTRFELVKNRFVAQSNLNESEVNPQNAVKRVFRELKIKNVPAKHARGSRPAVD